ncbi:helix-turn-helix domain-containing protein, partial [Candidatus Parcubacteria bacterium]
VKTWPGLLSFNHKNCKFFLQICEFPAKRGKFRCERGGGRGKAAIQPLRVRIPCPCAGAPSLSLRGRAAPEAISAPPLGIASPPSAARRDTNQPVFKAVGKAFKAGELAFAPCNNIHNLSGSRTLEGNTMRKRHHKKAQEILGAALNEKGWSVQELQIRCGGKPSREMFRQYVNGTSPPNKWVAKRIIQALNLSPEEAKDVLLDWYRFCVEIGQKLFPHHYTPPHQPCVVPRRQLLEKVQERLRFREGEQEKPRVIGLTGPPGVGKRTLANMLLAEVAEEARKKDVLEFDGSYYCSLSHGLNSTTDCLRELAEWLGLSLKEAKNSKDVRRLVDDHLSCIYYLLVVDDVSGKVPWEELIVGKEYVHLLVISHSREALARHLPETDIIEVPPFTPQEWRAGLLLRNPRWAEEANFEERAEELGELMGFLPLAMDLLSLPLRHRGFEGLIQALRQARGRDQRKLLSSLQMPRLDALIEVVYG